MEYREWRRNVTFETLKSALENIHRKGYANAKVHGPSFAKGFAVAGAMGGMIVASQTAP